MCVQSHVSAFQFQIEPVLGPHDDLKVLLWGAVGVKGQLKVSQDAAQGGLHLIDGEFLPNAVAIGNREREREKSFGHLELEHTAVISLKMALQLQRTEKAS